MEPTVYSFASELSMAVNSGLSRSVVLHGNTNDLFHFVNGSGPGEYIQLVPWLNRHYSKVKDTIQIVVELNGPFRVVPEEKREELKGMWASWRKSLGGIVDTNLMAGEQFENLWRSAITNPTQALEFLRQLTLASRSCQGKRLMIYIEAAELLLPGGDGDISKLKDDDKKRVAIVEDWFSDMEFMNSHDTVILIAKVGSQIHSRITELPQVYQIEVPSPDVEARAKFAEWYRMALPDKDQWDSPVPRPVWEPQDVARSTGGLSVLAMRQLLVEAGYRNPGQPIPVPMVTKKIEKFVLSQTGPGTVEFKRPQYTLDRVVGNSRVKKFVREELIPQCRQGAVKGFLITGPVGAGKTFLVEGMAGEMGLPVMLIKGVRDQWYGNTDKKIKIIRQTCQAVGQMLVLFDEADTKFGKLGPGAHETEARLTGDFQEMMSDENLNVIWGLLTARPHNLSADLKREGRAGDLTFPILDPDPTGADRDEFIKWIIGTVKPDFTDADVEEIRGLPRIRKMSAAGFSALRKKAKQKKLGSIHDLRVLMHNIVEPDNALDREYQTLQALLHTTWLPLLPPSDDDIDDRRRKWRERVAQLEAKGVR